MITKPLDDAEWQPFKEEDLPRMGLGQTFWAGSDLGSLTFEVSRRTTYIRKPDGHVYAQHKRRSQPYCIPCFEETGERTEVQIGRDLLPYCTICEVTTEQ